MTPGEFLFLAVGLVLGAIAAAAWYVLREGPGRAVRVTVTTGVIPARPGATLVPSPGPAMTAPARGGPADLLAHFAAGTDDGSDPGEAAVPAVAGSDPAAVAGSDPNAVASAAATGGPDPCAAERRQRDERCVLAERARAEAGRVAAALRGSQREYDELVDQAERAAERMDPRSVRAEKDRAQRTFHAARSTASDAAAIEEAARVWLGAINDINVRVREATGVAGHATDAARALLPVLEQRAVEADAARIAAETAEATCLAARESLAVCEERTNAPVSSPPPRAAPQGDDAAELELDAGVAGAKAAIMCLLRGERETMDRLVAELAGDDVAEQRRWRAALSNFVEAVIARAIEEGYLDFPADAPFWEPFAQEQARAIARALGSLGYRFDGLGGWVDDRVPSQRDLSLAVGYAGLDPMRIRHWPSDADTAALYERVRVSADEYLAGAAGEMSLADVVTLLGRRADGLADVWNEWGRVRPLLLGPG
jgi:hypothetical protein